MEELRIDGTLSNVSITSLGNASPRDLVVTNHLGSLRLDLRGAWARDADIGLASGAGEMTLRLPQGVAVEGLDTGRVEPPRESEMPRPTLRFRVRGPERLIIE